MKVTREAHVAACTSSEETETETLHSATETESRETQGSKTTPSQRKFLGVSRLSCGKLPQWRGTSDYSSRVLHSSAGVSTNSHVAVNYHKMELEELNRQEVAHEAAGE